jgi:hypothetical protein
MKGGKRGLYLPDGWEEGEGPLYVPEGASDVAALLDHGLRAVGRPSCTGGEQHLRALLAGKDIDVVILGENDRKEDGRWPGRDGAEAVARGLANALGRRVHWALPPRGHKDVRAYVTREVADGE